MTHATIASEAEKYFIQDEVRVAAPAEVVRGLVADVVGWTQLHPLAVHAEILADDGVEQLIQHWEAVGDHAVRTWWTRRRQEADGSRISFTHESVEAPFTSLSGVWTFAEQGGRTLVKLSHEFTVVHEAQDRGDELVALLREGDQSCLATLAHAAEHREELDRLIVSFTDPLFIAGDIKDVHDFLWEAGKWATRIPHVAGLTLEQPSPDVQFFDMDSSAFDAPAHTTRSVRVAVEPGIVVYKQTRLPALLDGHTGHWKLTRTPEGVIAEVRHTVTIKPSALHTLGAGTTVQDARNYVRQVLGATSLNTLRLAKAYAEERAGA